MKSRYTIPAIGVGAVLLVLVLSVLFLTETKDSNEAENVKTQCFGVPGQMNSGSLEPVLLMSDVAYARAGREFRNSRYGTGFQYMKAV